MSQEQILIVDDDEAIRGVLSAFLTEKDCEPKAAQTAEEGLALLRSRATAVAIVDLVLPGMDGLGLLTELKRISPDTEVIIMTSHASLDTAIEAIRRGAYDYLRKPFEDLEAVWVAVQRALERRSLSLKNRQLLSDLEQRNRELSASVKRLTSLIEAGRAMSAIHTLSELLDFFIELVVCELDVSRASLMLLNEKSRELRIAASRGISEELVQSVRVRLGEGISGWVAQKGKPILVKDVKDDPRVKDRIHPNLSDSFISSPIVLSIPIKRQEKVLGVINVTNKRSGMAFGDDDMAFLYGLAGQAAVAIEGARHFEELQQAYESLKATQDQLVASERIRALGQMAAGVAHDFNNLLSGILGRTQLLLTRLGQRNLDLEAVRSELQVVERLSLEGAETVRRIQDFTGIRKDVPTEAVDLHTVVRNAVEMTRPKWKDEYEARGIGIEVRLELGEVPATTGNAHELTQVVSNLILNAVEAMPQGGCLTLKTFRERDRIRLEVADTGTGMSKETQARIFEPFYTTKEPGRGLGLSIAYGIITRYQGEITVGSEEGVGSSFKIRLPIVPPRRRRPASKGAGSKEPFQPARILVIEDDDRNRRLFQEALSLNGHQVVGVPAGREGLALLKQGSFDVVITDLSMPGLSGWEVARGAKEADPQIRVILLSGWGIQQEAEQVKASGIDLVLSKPCPVKDLQQAVQQVLQDREKDQKKGG